VAATIKVIQDINKDLVDINKDLVDINKDLVNKDLDINKEALDKVDIHSKDLAAMVMDVKLLHFYNSNFIK
jgi:hypothetical protein